MKTKKFDEFKAQFLNYFTPSQLEAVKAVEGAVLLLAVPGSGKTTVLVARLGYMTLCLGIAPESIMTMTYTVAATREMKQRFAALFGQELADKMEFRTINGLSAKIIQHYQDHFTKEEPFRLLDSESEQGKLVTRIYCEVTGERYAPQSTVKDIRTGITYVKNMMLTDSEFRGVNVGVKQFPQIYARYCAHLKENRLMDYDDQMVYALRYLRKFPDLLRYFQDKYQYFNVDEAQDTSKIQHEIIKLLASKNGNLFMVGDEDQSIYGFRAAYPNALMQFDKDHPGAKVLLIEDNFRSTPEIIALANDFVSKNTSRREKTIRPTRESGEAVKIISVPTREAQFAYLLHEALNVQEETVILYRNNDSALPLIDLFERYGIAYNCRSFDASFFNHRILNDIRTIVRLAKNPKDKDAFMRIYYKFNLPISKDAALFACQKAWGSRGDILKELQNYPKLSKPTREGIRKLRDVLPRILTSDAKKALDIISNELQYRKYAKQFDLDVGKLSVLGILARNERKIEGLLQRLDELQVILKNGSDDSKSLLTLSTIHSAKGLEYERVFLLDVIDSILPAKPEGACKTKEDARNYQEDRRLFYVAMTRAKSELCLFSCIGSPESYINEVQAAPNAAVLKEKAPDAKLKYPPLPQTAERRNTAAKYTPAKPSKPANSNKPATPTLPPIAPAESTLFQDFKVGTKVIHSVFGPGTITAHKPSGNATATTIVFDKNNASKDFLLQACIKSGYIKLAS